MKTKFMPKTDHAVTVDLDPARTHISLLHANQIEKNTACIQDHGQLIDMLEEAGLWNSPWLAVYYDYDPVIIAWL